MYFKDINILYVVKNLEKKILNSRKRRKERASSTLFLFNEFMYLFPKFMYITILIHNKIRKKGWKIKKKIYRYLLLRLWKNLKCWKYDDEMYISRNAKYNILLKKKICLFICAFMFFYFVFYINNNKFVSIVETGSYFPQKKKILLKKKNGLGMEKKIFLNIFFNILI